MTYEALGAIFSKHRINLTEKQLFFRFHSVAPEHSFSRREIIFFKKWSLEWKITDIVPLNFLKLVLLVRSLLPHFPYTLENQERSSEGGLEAPTRQNPRVPLEPPPPWSDTLYSGLWRAVIMSSGQPPTPLPLPHFEKSSYAPVETMILKFFSQETLWMFSTKPKCFPNVIHNLFWFN